MSDREILLKKLRLDSGADDNEIKVAYEKLKQTYELIVISSYDKDIKEIAEKKLRELEKLADSVIGGMSLKSVYEGQYDEIVRAAYKLLGNRNAKAEDLNDMIGKLENTTMTSENYYLQTLLYLEINNGFPGCEKAKQTIENALVIEPRNESYLALKKGIDAVIESKIEYDEELKRIKEEEERELLERQRREEKEAIWQRRRAMCGRLCECTCESLTGICQCICSCCSCCDDCA